MNPDKALAELAERAGIVSVYRDLDGVEQTILPETRLALLRACGWQLDNDSMIAEALKQSKAEARARLLPEEIVVRSARKSRLDIPKPVNWRLVLDGSQSDHAQGRADEIIKLPALPSGIHKLTIQAGRKTETLRLIAAPGKAPSVEDLTGRSRLWGVNLALYGLNSGRNPGVGDYDDLAQASIALAENGAGFCGINPVHAIDWSDTKIISPYSPSHRGFLNTNHIAVDRITPMSDKSRKLLANWRERSVNGVADRVDYETHLEHHRPLLRSLFGDFTKLATPEQRAAFQGFCHREGAPLQRFAQYESLSDRHGADWRKWPNQLRHPPGGQPDDGQAYHMWLQWHADAQLQAAQRAACSAGMKSGLYLDLAVGSRRDGGESWVEQDSIAQGVSLGAPPDHLNPAGQIWNLAAYAPAKRAERDYKALRTLLARNMRHCGILRIDHILGLCRSFWIPDDGSPGGYVKQNFEALLAVLRMEAERNPTVIIGEDLGLEPEGFRKALRKSGIYSYSVLQYEKYRSGRFRKPSRLRADSLACFGTHDTPTLQGFAKERDIDWWQKLGWIDEKAAKTARRKRKLECAQLEALAPAGAGDISNGKISGSMSRAIHTALAASSVALVSVQFDDIEGEVEAQNLPGTIDEHPNWRRRTKTPVDRLKSNPGLREMGRLMSKNGRGKRKPQQWRKPQQRNNGHEG